jgi:predicted Zn-dependent protease
MKRIVFQGIVGIALFFTSLFFVSKFDWLSIFKIQQATNKTEEKLGELLWEVFKKSDQEIKSPVVLNAVDSIVNKICIANKIDRKSIKVHVLENDQINAFALPNGHLIIYSALIQNSNKQEELSGVIGHEIAHIELNQVMKKLVKEIGLSVLISMTTGNGGPEVIKETAKMLSSSAFDRSMEKEADIKSVDYLVEAKINPEPFADFLFSLAGKEDPSLKYLSWISTHPDSKARAEYIIEYSSSKKNTKFEPIISPNTWKKVQKELERN